MGDEAPWSPWQHLDKHYPHITVYETELPGDRLGCTNHIDSVWLTYGLTCAEQRCTLAHEIGHLERGPLPADATPEMVDAEEAAVDLWAARRLIDARDLARAFMWSLHLDEIAEELWVDMRMLRARLRGATDEEQDMIMRAISRKGGAV